MLLIAAVTVMGRLVLAALFILAGVSKFIDPEPVRSHMEKEGVPGLLLYVVAPFEIVAGIALAAGWELAIAAAALSLFCIATAFLIHLHLSDRVERTQFVKDLALAGGLAVIAARAVS